MGIYQHLSGLFFKSYAVVMCKSTLINAQKLMHSQSLLMHGVISKELILT